MNKYILTKSCVLSVIIVITLSGILTGCQNDADSLITETDLPFLSFSSNNSNINICELSERDLDVLTSAFQRINLVNKDGLYYMVETSADQINVTGAVFSILKIW